MPDENEEVNETDKLVNDISNNFYKHRKINRLDYLASDIKSNVSYLSGVKKIKKYYPDLLKLESQHKNLKEIIEELSEMKNIQEHELKYILEKENEVNESVKQMLLILKKVQRKRVVAYVGKIIITIGLIASLVQIGRFGYEYKDEIKEFYNINVKPKIVEYFPGN